MLSWIRDSKMCKCCCVCAQQQRDCVVAGKRGVWQRAVTCPKTTTEPPQHSRACARARQAPKHKVQDVSSWMTGIQEVPLPMAYKLRNIEDTEAAKKVLLHSAAAGNSRRAPQRVYAARMHARICMTSTT